MPTPWLRPCVPRIAVFAVFRCACVLPSCALCLLPSPYVQAQAQSPAAQRRFLPHPLSPIPTHPHPQEKARAVRELTATVLSRPPKMCNFIEWMDKKVIYKRYASLFFIACVDKDDNELIVLEQIHLFVEVLDR